MIGRNVELIQLEGALAMSRQRSVELNRTFIDPRLTKLMKLIGADTPIVRASGCRFWDADGREYLDFLGGTAAASFGYGHPRLTRAMELVDGMPVLLESLNHLAGALAHNLAAVAPGALRRVFFASSGAEAVEGGIKLARAATARKKLAACLGGFHGRTVGALSLMSERDFRQPFEPLLADIVHVKYGDPEALETALRGREVAGFIVEPVQGEGGIVVPPHGYLRAVREICSRHGTLMIADEVQTGLGRTGRLFAVDREGATPDALLLGKALGGGIMPLSAVVTTEAAFKAAKGATRRSPFHTATFGGNTRACAAGLAALEILVTERLDERADESGTYLLHRLRELKARHPLIADVRGLGLMIGVEFAPATHGLATALTAGAVNRLSSRFMSGIVLMELRQHHRVMTAFTLNDPNVLRLEPPLNIQRADLDYVVDALDQTLTRLKTFPRAALRSCRHFATAPG